MRAPGGPLLLLLLATLPTLTGRWRARGEVVVRGGGPAFEPRQRTAVLAAVGQTAQLDCRVLHLADKAVSWVRGGSLAVLAHGGAVFTADARVAAAERRGGARSDHSLTISRLRLADSGRYECQLNTDPKMSLYFNLTVVDEEVGAVVVRAAAREVWGAAGGAATLACTARYEPAPRALPRPPLALAWARAGRPLPPERAVSLHTERWPARVESRLTLAGLTAHDQADYTCSAGDQHDTVSLRLLESAAEAMQRDQSTSAGPRARAELLAALLAALFGALLGTLAAPPR